MLNFMNQEGGADFRSAIHDLKCLFALRETVETLDVSALPTVQLIFPQKVMPLRRVGLLCGSFNPLTFAHTELAERAIQEFSLAQVFFTLAKVTVDKEHVTGMSIEDRLLSLSLYVEQDPALGVALVNRGLYFEQAQAFHSLFGDQTALSFLIGMDKLLQIFDSRYYQDRDAALRQLFSLASLIVANRADMSGQSFAQLLDQPENQPFREYVRFFTLPTTVTNLSATQVRQRLAAEQPISAFVPPEIAAFINETRAYYPPQPCKNEQLDVYALRQSLLTFLYADRVWAEQQVNFGHLLNIACTPSEKGYAYRSATDAKTLREVLMSSPSDE